MIHKESPLCTNWSNTGNRKTNPEIIIIITIKMKVSLMGSSCEKNIFSLCRRQFIAYFKASITVLVMRMGCIFASPRVMAGGNYLLRTKPSLFRTEPFHVRPICVSAKNALTGFSHISHLLVGFLGRSCSLTASQWLVSPWDLVMFPTVNAPPHCKGQGTS